MKNSLSRLQLWAFLLVAVAAFYANVSTFNLARDNEHAVEQNRLALEQIKREGVERRDQICLSAEREHLSKVLQLSRTYEYIKLLDPSEYTTSLNQAVLRQLPQTEEAAKTDVAPAFCDETLPGGKPVGLPEPDPVVPERPKEVSDALKTLDRK
jgi:hypothetical protein